MPSRYGIPDAKQLAAHALPSVAKPPRPAWASPPVFFVLKHRVPVGLMRDGRAVWSVMSTNLAIAGVGIGMCALMGIQDFLLVQVPIALLAGSAGVWLFHVQHQFEHAYWAARKGRWSFQAAALQGATHYDLPSFLRWFTANIGIHHVHHLASRIPGYRLREPLEEHPELRDLGRLTLWDEDSSRLVGFRDLQTSAVEFERT